VDKAFIGVIYIFTGQIGFIQRESRWWWRAEQRSEGWFSSTLGIWLFV